MEDIQVGKEEVKLSLYRWHNFICRKLWRFHKEKKKKQKRRPNKYSRVVEYKNQHTKILYFYSLTMNNMKRKVGKKIPFITASKRVEYWRINLSRTYRVCKQCWKILKTQIKEKASCVYGLEYLILFKVPILLKAIYGYNAIPLKIPIAYFEQTENHSKIHMEL